VELRQSPDNLKRYRRWTNGQAERMNRTVKDATVKVYHYDDLETLKAHVLAFVAAYNFAKHLKALRWRTPHPIYVSEEIADTEQRQTAPGGLAEAR
jgi:hypothetical protein